MLCVPAGFLQVTYQAINAFIEAYPELCYGDRYAPHVDLFNHGARDWTWFGEDYSLCHRWKAIPGKEIWCVPNINLNHHHEGEVFKGNYHEFLLAEPGGSKSANPIAPPTVSQTGGSKDG